LVARWPSILLSVSDFAGHLLVLVQKQLSIFVTVPSLISVPKSEVINEQMLLTMPGMGYR
jgi:hypothetical protein